MKKTKFAVLFTALVAMLGLSSCLSDPDPYVSNIEIMKVNDYMGTSFKSMNGIVYESNTPLGTTIETPFAFVQYKYDSRTENPASGKVSAEIQFSPIEEINLGYSEEEKGNAPMNSMASNSGFMFDKDNLLLLLDFMYEYSNDQDELEAELKSHSYTISLDPEKESTSEILYLRLNHSVTDVDAERGQRGTEYRSFNLRYLLNGSIPEVIEIAYQVKSYSSTGELMDSTTPIKINYSDFVEEYDKVFSDSQSY